MEKTYDFKTVIDRNGTGSLKLKRFGERDLICLWLADMDFASAPEISSALKARIEHGIYGYTVPYESVENAVLDYLKSYHHLQAQRDWFHWMPGLVPALNTAARAFGHGDDAVMTHTPVYPPFLMAPEWQGRILQGVPMKIVDHRYEMDFEAMEKAITPKTRLFYLCNPHNPTGRVFTRNELQAIVDFCKVHQLILVSDEIHCDLILDTDKNHLNIFQIDPWTYENAICLMAPSKTYNVPGLACSYILIPDPKLRAQFQRAARGMITEVNCLGYAGCEAAYRHGGPWLTALLDVLRKNYQIVKSFIETETPKIKFLPMEATYLAWLHCDELGLEHPATYFESRGLALGDGRLFGQPQSVRLTFATPETYLREGLNRLKIAYDALAL